MRVLHCLSQRPLLTGSGITLDAIGMALDSAPADPSRASRFTWSAVYERIEAAWSEV